MNVQNYPTTDSTPTDPFEGLVAAYYQIRGYITSSNKWFWVREERKRQRGYQDIDVLAINAVETVIVSVTGNLDDKVRYTREGALRSDMLERLEDYFKRTREYLALVPEYRWLLDNGRQIRKVVAFASGDKLAERIRDEIGKYGIELLSAKEIVRYLQATIAEQKKRGLRTNNQFVKLMQLMLTF